MTRTPKKPGIYPGVTYAEYEFWEGVRHSDLRHYRRSAAHARVALLNPRESKALDFGNAYHCAVLEPERYIKEFVRGLELGNRSSADKDAHARFRQQHFGKTVLTAAEWDLIGQMAPVLRAHETAAAFLAAPGKNEVAAVWIDPETGLTCKLRADALRVWQGWTWCGDLKTTRDASPEGWPREVHTYGYDSAAAWYLDGLDVLSPRPRRFVHIAQEKEPPFAVAVYELQQPSIEKGRARCRRYLRAHAAAVSSGQYPAYPAGILPCDLPGWSLKQEDGHDDDEPAGDGAGTDEPAAAEA
jgi:hypothetical protein